jgi:hypothetical protein
VNEESSTYCSVAWLNLDPEDGNSAFHQNNNTFLPEYMQSNCQKRVLLTSMVVGTSEHIILRGKCFKEHPALTTPFFWASNHCWGFQLGSYIG